MHYKNKRAPDYLSESIKALFSSITHRDIIILCVGTDRSTGDSLGPLVGTKLLELGIFPASNVYGTLHNPVHALNLISTLNFIKKKYKNPYIIAIDASLGDLKDIGKILLLDSPLNPGLILDKKLPSIGDFSILAIVNENENNPNKNYDIFHSYSNALHKPHITFPLRCQSGRHSYP